MAVQEAGTESTVPELEGALRFVARQPILDLRGRVHGYELLFRSGREACFSGDGNLATRIMLDNTVVFGLERLTGGLPAFVNCTLEALTEGLVEVLPASMTVLEILEDLEPTPELIRACCHLKTLGYRLALDDFNWKPGIEPLVELADYIKVDFKAVNRTRRRELLNRLDGASVALVAEKVETQEEYQQARAEGFTLIQGYYFCRPSLMENRKVSANRLSHIEILKLLHGPSIDHRKLTRALKRDTSLTYRLLRLVNSPLCAMRQEVTSIQSALMLVGEATFRRIAMLAIASDFNANQSAEILRMAFERARFCELAAGLCGLPPSEQYLIGMVSLFPAMLRILMEDMVKMLPLRQSACDALLGRDLPEGILLHWIVCEEHGNWAACDKIVRSHGLRHENLMRCHAEAIAWTQEALKSNA